MRDSSAALLGQCQAARHAAGSRLAPRRPPPPHRAPALSASAAPSSACSAASAGAGDPTDSPRPADPAQGRRPHAPTRSRNLRGPRRRRIPEPAASGGTAYGVCGQGSLRVAVSGRGQQTLHSVASSRGRGTLRRAARRCRREASTRTGGVEDGEEVHNNQKPCPREHIAGVGRDVRPTSPPLKMLLGMKRWVRPISVRVS